MTVTVEHTQVYVVPAPEIASLFDAFFNFPTSNEYEEQLKCVHEAMSAQATSS